MPRNIFSDSAKIAMEGYTREEFEDQVARSVITGLCMLHRLTGSEWEMRKVMRRNMDSILVRMNTEAHR